MKVKRFVATGLFFFCLAAIVLFSISAILMLLDFYDLGRAACIFGFAALALFLFTDSLAMVRGSKMQHDISPGAV
jgi:hypothetical protein